MFSDLVKSFAENMKGVPKEESKYVVEQLATIKTLISNKEFKLTDKEIIIFHANFLDMVNQMENNESQWSEDKDNKDKSAAE